MRLLGVQLCSRGLLLYRILAYIKMHCLQTVEIGAKKYYSNIAFRVVQNVLKSPLIIQFYQNFFDEPYPQNILLLGALFFVLYVINF